MVFPNFRRYSAETLKIEDALLFQTNVASKPRGDIALFRGTTTPKPCGSRHMFISVDKECRMHFFASFFSNKDNAKRKMLANGEISGNGIEPNQE